jgi:hypothetical protein
MISTCSSSASSSSHGGAKTLGGAAAVHRGVAHPDDDDAGANLLDVLEVHVGKEVDADEHLIGCIPSAGNIELFPLGRATPDEYRIVAFVEQRLERRNRRAVAHVGTHVDHVAALFVEHLCGETKRRDVDAHQPTGLRILFVNRDVVAVRQQVVGDRQRGGTGTDERHALAVLDGGRLGEKRRDLVAVVGRHALEATDGHGLLLDAASPAGRLARAVADAAQNARKDIRLAVEEVALGVFALGDQANVAGHVGVGRAGPLAIHDPVVVVRVGHICRCHDAVLLGRDMLAIASMCSGPLLGKKENPLFYMVFFSPGP